MANVRPFAQMLPLKQLCNSLLRNSGITIVALCGMSLISVVVETGRTETETKTETGQFYRDQDRDRDRRFRDREGSRPRPAKVETETKTETAVTHA